MQITSAIANMIAEIEKSGIGGDRLEEIRKSGLLSALLSACNLPEIDHAEVRRALNLSIKQFIFCDHDPFTDGFGNPGHRSTSRTTRITRSYNISRWEESYLRNATTASYM